MNPCSHFQKDIALLAAGALDEARNRPLRRHLAECAGCRQYREELARLCREHASALNHQPLPASAEAFHRRLVDRIKAPEAAPPGRVPQSVFTRWFGLPQRLAFAGLALCLLVIGTLEYRVKDSHPNPIPAVARRSVARTQDAPSSFRSYQLAANQSGAALDALLARNAANSPDPGHPVTAALRTLEGLTD